jgi:hypothetical protein
MKAKFNDAPNGSATASDRKAVEPNVSVGFFYLKLYFGSASFREVMMMTKY